MKAIRYLILMLCGFMLVAVQAHAIPMDPITIFGPSPAVTDASDPLVTEVLTDVFKVDDAYYDNYYGDEHWQGYTGPGEKVIIGSIKQITDMDYWSYKADVDKDGSSVNSSGLYFTDFFDNPDPSNATITWGGEGFIDPDEAYLAVKDGNNDPTWYLFNLTFWEWDGKGDIELKDFWPDSDSDDGGISHVSLWGRTTQVPEPAMMLLLGAGLAGIGLFGRRRRSGK